MKLVEITSRERWDAFVSALDYAQFTQSWVWGEFQSSLGKDVRRFFVQNGQQTVAATQLVHLPRPIVGGYWLAARGPVFAEVNKEQRAENSQRKILDFLSANLKLPRSLFIRIEPLLPAALCSPLSVSYVPHRSYNPATTVINDLTKSEDDLLVAMHQKTRYNIRVAEKHNVHVREGTEKDLETFLNLAEETAKRDRFLQLDRAYLAGMYRMLADEGMARLRVAEHEGKIIAANMEMRYGDTVTYLHGATSSEARNVMAPFALHWSAILHAKAEGAKKYDWWGCNPDDEKDPNYKKNWEGITRFKLGWGGERVNLVGTLDLPTRPFVYSALKAVGRV